MTTKQKENQEQQSDIATLVYTGEYDGTSTKTVHGYYEIDPKTHFVINFNHEIYMSKALKGSRNPGAIFRVEVAERDENGNIKSWYSSTSRIAGFIQNKEIKETFLLEWQITLKARREERINISKASENIIENHLEVIRNNYRKLSSSKRRAFLVYVISYLTRGT